MKSRSVFEQATELVVTIQAGEGGEDSRLFAQDLLTVYKKYATARGITSEIISISDSQVSVQFTGRGVGRAFANEAGQHVVQRNSPTERHGRRHTSLVSVAVLPLPPKHTLKPLADKDIEVKCQTGKQKAGGQHANKTASAVRMKHKPTGFHVFINGRNQHENRKRALEILTARVNNFYKEEAYNIYADNRFNNMSSRSGIGRRGEKRRTYNFIEERITDHILGKKTSNVKAFMKGDLSVLFDSTE